MRLPGLCKTTTRYVDDECDAAATPGGGPAETEIDAVVLAGTRREAVLAGEAKLHPTLNAAVTATLLRALTPHPGRHPNRGGRAGGAGEHLLRASSTGPTPSKKSAEDCLSRQRVFPRSGPCDVPRRLSYSHSIVEGGFDEMSYTTRLTPGTSLTIRLLMAPRTSYGSFAQSAVIPSSLWTARIATTLP